MEPRIREITDHIYVMLFNDDAAGLRKRLNLKDDHTDGDDNLRDSMGIDAIDAINKVERDVTIWMGRANAVTMETVKDKITDIGSIVAKRLQKIARDKNVDPLTGITLEG